MAAYQERFVATILVDGKSQRELNESGERTVKIPFGSEYVIRLKNKTGARAVAEITIDGTDVCTGNRRFVLEPNQTVDVERFVDDLDKGKRFKFISLEEGERTGEIQDPTEPDNGLIVVRFWKEVPKPKSTTWGETKSADGRSWSATRNKKCYKDFGSSDSFHSSSTAGATTESHQYSADNIEVKTAAEFYASRGIPMDEPIGAACCNSGGVETLNASNFSLDYCMKDLPSTAGATVEGKTSNQSFKESTEHFELEAVPVTIQLRLKAPKFETRSDWVVKTEGLLPKSVYYQHGSQKVAFKNCSFNIDNEGRLTIHPKDFRVE